MRQMRKTGRKKKKEEGRKNNVYWNYGMIQLVMEKKETHTYYLQRKEETAVAGI